MSDEILSTMGTAGNLSTPDTRLLLKKLWLQAKLEYDSLFADVERTSVLLYARVLNSFLIPPATKILSPPTGAYMGRLGEGS